MARRVGSVHVEDTPAGGASPPPVGTPTSLALALEERDARLAILLGSPDADDEAFGRREAAPGGPSPAIELFPEDRPPVAPIAVSEDARLSECEFAVGRDVEVSLSDESEGVPSWSDVLCGVCVADHGDGTYDVRFDSGDWETLPSALVRLRPVRVGDVVEVRGTDGRPAGGGTVVAATNASSVDVLDPDGRRHRLVPADRVRRRRRPPPLPRAQCDDDDGGGGGGGDWLASLLCGCAAFDAAVEPLDVL